MKDPGLPEHCASPRGPAQFGGSPKPLSHQEPGVSASWLPTSWTVARQVILFLQLSPDFSGFKYVDNEFLFYVLSQEVSITTKYFVWILLSTASSTELSLHTY